VIFLIVGLDKHTLVPWHDNINAGDVTSARRMARARAAAEGIDVVVAAVIGPNLSVLSDPDDERARSGRCRAGTPARSARDRSAA
jgi:hypothetical protein